MRNKPASHQQHAKKSAARNKRIELEGGVRKNRLVAEPAQSLAALGPDLIPLARVFPVQPGLDVAKVNGELEAAFNDLASLRERNPFGNSVKLLALEINKRLDKGSLTYGGKVIHSPYKPGTVIKHTFLGEFGYRQFERYVVQPDGTLKLASRIESQDFLWD